MSKTLQTPDHLMVVIYDGDCPFCSNFVQLLALKKAVGRVELVDARSGDSRVLDVVTRGYDLDEGMIVLFGAETYYGADAVALISSLTSNKAGLGAVLAWLLSNPRRAKALYPWMKAGRKIVLTLLRRKPIAASVTTSPGGAPP